jgi:ABC-type Zn uptake system ZnuABC Zn-binding protein ZnuA
MREAKVPLLIADPSANPALIRQVAEKGGARPVVLMPSGYDYLGMFEENVRRLIEALKG